MFRLPSPEDRWPTAVEVAVPRPDGKPETAAFEVSFRYVASSEIAPLTDQEAAERVVAGWKDVADSDGKTLAFSEEALAAAADVRWWAKAVVEAYLERFDPPKNS